MKPGNTQGMRLRLWTIAAVTAPLAHFTGIGYMACILAAGAILPLNCLAGNGFRNLGRTLSLLEWIWLMLVLAHLMPLAGDCWGTRGAEIAVPLALLILAIAAGEGEKPFRIGAVLFWGSGLMLAGILLIAVRDVKLRWLEPAAGVWSGELIVTLLVPSLMGLLQEKKNRDAAVLITEAVLTAGFAAFTQGVLNIKIAEGIRSPFYEGIRSIGTVSAEPIAAVVITVTWFCFCSLLVRSGIELLKKCGIKGLLAKIATLATVAGLMLTGFRLPGSFLMAGSLILWVLIPITLSKNKSKKVEKSA